MFTRYITCVYWCLARSIPMLKQNIHITGVHTHTHTQLLQEMVELGVV
jgi:hypothetical protein